MSITDSRKRIKKASHGHGDQIAFDHLMRRDTATSIGMLFHVFYLALASTVVNTYVLPRQNSWPNGPLRTDGPTIVDASGSPVTYVGVNLPGHNDAMIPEGLQYSSVSDIISKIRALNMNVVRLTYAIEMVNDILDNGGDVSIKDTLENALGSVNGSIVLEQILEKNPSFTSNMTRLEVFNAVAEECARQEVYVHLDNHMSKAGWCCSLTDGNGWFGDTYFDVDKWKRGLAYMAGHAKSWKAQTSVGLRNELRRPEDNAAVNATYGWPLWYDEMTDAAARVHEANQDTLIFMSGLDYDTTLEPITAATDLGDGRVFNLSDFSFSDKIVFELHDYDNSAANCSKLQEQLHEHGFNAMDTSATLTAKNVAPVVLTEFGFAQNGTDYHSVYAQCLNEFCTERNVGWMQWALPGSYYIRSGTQDYDETWGLLSHDWTSWRDERAVREYTVPMVQGTLS